MNSFSSDILVIGGGGAGLMAAITARQAGKSVTVVSKLGPGAGTCTTVSAAAFSHAGTVRTKESHREDTLRAGQGLNESKLVDLLVENAAEDVGSLQSMGVVLEERALGYYGNAKSPFFKGSAIVTPLTQYAKKIGVKFLHPYLIWNLIIRQNEVIGAWGFDRNNDRPVLFLAGAVILASGGGSAIYARTDNPASICGDGYALAARAGLNLIDMEFIQFYPIMSAFEEGRRNAYFVPQIAEVSKFVNEEGIDLAEKYSIQRPLAINSRDLTSRVMMLEGKTYLDFSDTTDEDWDNVAKNYESESVMQIKDWLETNLLKETKRIPISPTAHFCVGGIYVNERMETSLPGLYAAGEVTGGLHGANRLGGNALSEAIVSGKQAGLSATAAQGNIHFSQHGMLIMDHTAMQANELIATLSSGTQPPSPLRKELNNLMWEKVGVLRTKEGLNQALQQIKEMNKLDLSRKEAGIAKVLELKNMLLTSEIICRSALFREESRGCHYRMDFPDTDNTNWLTHSQLELEDDIMSLNKLPIK